MRQNHRRIKRDRLQTIYVRKRTVRKDSEGVPEESFSAAYGMQAEVWAASERRQIEAYGDRIADIANVRIQGKYAMSDTVKNGVVFLDPGDESDSDAYYDESDSDVGIVKTLAPGDGICINAAQTADPDYSVLTITFSRPLLLEIERR